MPFEFMSLRSGRPNTAPTSRSEEALMLLALVVGVTLGLELVDGWPGWLLSVGLGYGFCAATSAGIAQRRSRQA